MKKLFIAALATLAFYGCGGSSDSDKSSDTYKPSTSISYRFLDKNQSTGDLNHPESKTLRRSYAYQITGFDKDNPACWDDVYQLAETVAQKEDYEMITMVYFFAPSDSLVLWHSTAPDWDINWNENQDSLWIGNYIRYANGNTQMVKGTNWK